jgi:hypothetical protein
LFGEDGPHTLADLQQLQMFMGMTTATKVAQIMRDTIQRKGAHNYDVLHAGQQIPEMSEYAVHSFAKKYQRMKQEGKYVPVTLSPIAPFDIALHCVVYELLADAGFEHLSHFADAPVNNEAMASLADTIQAMLHQQPDRLIAYTSLGVAFDITGRDHYQTQGAFTRGTVNNKKIRDAIIHAKEFSDYKEHSVKMQDFFEMYESQAGIATKEVIGYLAAFPVARDMRKEGHF